MIEINLLPPKNLLSRKEQEIRQKLLAGAIISSALCLLFGGALFVAGVGLSRQADSLENRKQQLTASYESLKETAQDIRVLQGKIAGIKKIKALRLDYASEITALSSFLKGTTTIKGLTLSPPDAVSVSASSPDATSLNKFFDKVSGKEGKVPLKDVVITGLSLNNKSVFVYDVAGRYVP